MPYNTDPQIFDPPFGSLRTGAITKYDFNTNRMKVKLTGSPYYSGDKTTSVLDQEIEVSYPLTFSNQFSPDSAGLFIGAPPVEGTPVVVGVEAPHTYRFVSFLPENRTQIPSLKPNELLLYANDNARITLNQENSDIYLGSKFNNVYINSQNEFLSTRFKDVNYFTQASRNFIGLIKRERRDSAIDSDWTLNNRINDDDYDSNYRIISLDPTLSPNSLISGKEKNPPLVENREIIYEFQDNSSITNDLDESSIYSSSGLVDSSIIEINRRKSKADTLGLTLTYPNYLIETVKGTVVDIFGNILDINRYPLPIGENENTLNTKISKNLSESYLKIRELQRKSIAYHFEINARKDLKIKNNKLGDFSDLFGYDETFPNSDYGRNRSRFFIDIDKEGQFKLNVPASSETGNIPLLTRYENYSTIDAAETDEQSPNELIYRKDLLDIVHDSFARPKLNLGKSFTNSPGSITVKDGDTVIALQDRRFEGVHIKHGTAYHDILSTCYAHSSTNAKPSNPFSSSSNFFKYIIDEEFINYMISNVPLIDSVCSDTIQISGENANAGGRSGSINFDGSIEMNIGANTVDRQSLWLDTAGGIIANIGRDNNNASAAISMNGNVYFQIGGFGVEGDSRFVTKNNDQIGAVLDLRVFDSGKNITMLRIDDNGVTLTTPGNLNIYARGDIKFKGASLDIDVENCTIQGRGVQKIFGGHI
jgi:hypothetical protein